MSEAVEIWAEAMQDVLRDCLPHELRVQVLSRCWSGNAIASRSGSSAWTN